MDFHVQLSLSKKIAALNIHIQVLWSLLYSQFYLEKVES